MTTALLSIVLVNFNMARELPRTLFTLQPPYQQNIRADEVEIIVVDNGSTQPVIVPPGIENIRLLCVENATHSPVAAINMGLANASTDFIGVMIDGARMVSPQLLHFALVAKQLHSRAIISTLGFHLGKEVQTQSVRKGYCQEVEDRLLESVPWRDNGYELFNISVFANSSRDGWFLPIAESNALFMPKTMWHELDGVDMRFQTPGGGLVNLDTYARACALADTKLVTILGEGTFHQVHGGIATNQQRADATWTLYHAEYMSIRGHPFTRPQKIPLHVGAIRKEHKKSLELSLRNLT